MARICAVFLLLLLVNLQLKAQNDTDTLSKAYFDYNETIDVLDATTANSIGILNDIKNYSEIRAYKAHDNYEIAITTNNKNTIRKTITNTEFEYIQQKTTNYLIAQQRNLKNALNLVGSPQKNNRLPNRSKFYTNETNEGGRNTLIISSTLYGFYYGSLLSTITKTNKESTFRITPILLGVYANTLGAYLYARNIDIHYGAAVQYSTSSFIGTQHGDLFYQIINPADNTAKSQAGAQLIGGLAEGIAGYYIARRADLAPGQAVMASSNAFWGIIEGRLLATAFSKTFNQTNLQLLRSVVLATSYYGYYLGYSLTKRYSYTIGDGIIFNNVIAIGYLAASAAVLQFNNLTLKQNPYIALATIALAYPISIALAENLLKDYDFKSQQGLVISLGTIFGAGIGIAAAGKYPSAPTAYLSTSIGAALAFAGAYLYEKQFAQTGLLGCKEKLNMQLSPTLTASDYAINSNPLNNLNLGFQFNCRF